MFKTFFGLIAVFLFVSQAHSYIYKIVVDGSGSHIIFAKSKVNGAVAWNQAEEENLTGKFLQSGGTSTVTVVDISPEAYILDISQSYGPFRTEADFKEALTKAGFMKFILKTINELSYYENIEDQDTILSTKAKLAYEQSVYEVLP